MEVWGVEYPVALDNYAKRGEDEGQKDEETTEDVARKHQEQPMVKHHWAGYDTWSERWIYASYMTEGG